MVKQNLTWSAAAKWYILVVGLIATNVTALTDVPSWVPPVIGVATAIATWLKSQTPVTAPAGEPV